MNQPNKLQNISEKSPRDAANVIGAVENRNYLAHAIREIEHEILKMYHQSYQIVTFTSKTLPKSKVFFFAHGCLIRLPCDCEKSDAEEKKTRLLLAHELGHLVYNIDIIGKILNGIAKPRDLKNLNKRSDEEECYAWEFSYYLIKLKSSQHQNNTQINKFVYKDEELEKEIEDVLKDRPEIRDPVMNSINTRSLKPPPTP